jgi:hypothetical protein
MQGISANHVLSRTFPNLSLHELCPPLTISSGESAASLHTISRSVATNPKPPLFSQRLANPSPVWYPDQLFAKPPVRRSTELGS